MDDPQSRPHRGSAQRVSAEPLLRIRGGGLSFGDRRLWSGLDLDVAPGEFIAVLGANGTGKSSLLKSILGQQRLSTGTIEIGGSVARRGDRRLGYIPQQRIIPEGTPVRARDLVMMGLNGHRFGPPLPRRGERERVDDALAEVGATDYANSPVGVLSGGEQQRLRAAQALVGRPELLLCDEPLLSLDLHHQRAICDLIDHRRHRDGTATLFVTHDINPVFGMVDRVLYLADRAFLIGTPDEVLRSDVLSDLYGTPVEVVHAAGRVLVVGAPDRHAEHGPTMGGAQ